METIQRRIGAFRLMFFQLIRTLSAWFNFQRLTEEIVSMLSVILCFSTLI